MSKYEPLPDTENGWRQLGESEARRVLGMAKGARELLPVIAEELGTTHVEAFRIILMFSTAAGVRGQ